MIFVEKILKYQFIEYDAKFYGEVFYRPYTNTFKKLFGQQLSSAQDLLKETQLMFVNADPLIEYSRPSQQNVAYIGGLTMQKAVPLDENGKRSWMNAKQMWLYFQWALLQKLI